MQCHVYKSTRKADTYVYLRQTEGFDCLPASLRAALGELRPVLTLDLSQTQRLARVELAMVRERLAAQGYFLQLPPTEPGLTARPE
jgi:hypothetical protein